MKTINETFKIYSFDELPDEAKEYAIENMRTSESYLSYDWWDIIYEDATTIARLMGWDIGKIYFSGFWSQGDGACFEGSLEYKIGSYKNVTEYAPNDETIAFIAKKWQELQRKHFYALHATINQCGHYYHERSMSCDVEDTRIDNYWYNVPYESEKEILELCAEFAQWIYKNLEKHYDYLMSDEGIADFLIPMNMNLHMMVKFTIKGNNRKHPVTNYPLILKDSGSIIETSNI